MSTVPPVPQWVHGLTKMSQNDFQSILMKREGNVISPPKTLGRFVHFLRCSLCGLESINKTRFDSHLPCSQMGNAEHRYYLHTCSSCFACSTSQSLMDEHIDLFHKGTQAELIRTQEVLRPAAMTTSMTPSAHSPTSVATNTSGSSPPFRRPNKSSEFTPDVSKRGDDNGCLDLSTSAITTMNAAAAAATTMSCEEQTRGGVEYLKKCHICSAELTGGVDELTRHLTFVHLIPMPLMLGQLAAMAVGMKSGQSKPFSPSTSSATNIPPPLPPPPPSLPSLLPIHENMPHGGWDIPSLLAVSNSLGRNSPGERPPQLSFPFGQFDSMPQQTPPPPLPLGSKNFFGLNFDLPPLPLLERNGEIGPRHPSTSEPEFKRARIDPPLGMEVHSFFPRFPATSTGAQVSSTLYTLPPPPPPPQLTAGLLPRIVFPQVSSAQQSPESLAKASSTKGSPEGRLHQSEETPVGTAAAVPVTAPPGIVHNTLRKTKSDMKVIHRYLVQVKNDTREIHEISPQDLCSYIQDFIVTAKKKDGHEYEPESLKAFVHSLERHLKYHNYPHSVLKDPEFAPARLVLSQRLNELRALSQANGSSNVHRNQTDGGKCDPGFNELHDSNKVANFNSLLQTGLLGPANPQALLNSIWLILRTQFNVVGTQKHRTLTWGQFQCVTNVNSQDLLRFISRSGPQEVRFCHGHGGLLGVRVFDGHEGSGSNGSVKRQILPFDCVEIFNFYARLRPAECRGPEEPLYLCPDSTWDRGGPWFKPAVAGAQLLSRIPRLLGMKPPRDPPPPSISETSINPLFPNTHVPSLYQLRDNLLATMNSFIADKIGRTEASSTRELPPPPLPPFLSPQNALAPENLSVLATGIVQFPQPLLEGEKVQERDRGMKPAQGWNSPLGSSLDGSVDDASASSPKSQPAPSVFNNSTAPLPDYKPPMTP
ncbi:hypothetical protein ECG_00998 [Echinococcus granulosus]|nr:hypothetical protein ECG_00998 [Echinococcus granulosus]